MSFIPNDRQRLDAELARERQREIEQRAEHYSDTHGDNDPAPPGNGPLARLTKRVRTLLRTR